MPHGVDALRFVRMNQLKTKTLRIMKKPTKNETRHKSYRRPGLFVTCIEPDAGYAMSSVELDPVEEEDFTWY